MRVGYAKLGRSMLFDEAAMGTVGGDKEPPRLLRQLALRNPHDDFIIIGRNPGTVPADIGMPSNVTNPWTEWGPEWLDRHRSYAKSNGYKRLHSPLSPDEVPWVTATLTEMIKETVLGLDAIVIWAGQHGTSNAPIPKIGDTWDGEITRPQDSFIFYCSYLTRGINMWRDQTDGCKEEIWLHSDARNYLKCRDLKWPLRAPQLGQFNLHRPENKHERWRDTRNPSDLGFEARWEDGIWVAPHDYMYSRLELCSVEPELIPNDPVAGWEERVPFGIFINEARAYVGIKRVDVMEDWVLPLGPSWMHGKWGKESLARLGVDIQPLPEEEFFSKFQTARCTFTTPSSGSGWATTKPWEAFAAGVVCFFHPAYDSQGHVIPTLAQVRDGLVTSETLASLAQWLRVENPEQLRRRVELLSQDRDTWEQLVRMQRKYYEWAWEQNSICQLIEERMHNSYA